MKPFLPRLISTLIALALFSTLALTGIIAATILNRIGGLIDAWTSLPSAITTTLAAESASYRTLLDTHLTTLTTTTKSELSATRNLLNHRLVATATAARTESRAIFQPIASATTRTADNIEMVTRGLSPLLHHLDETAVQAAASSRLIADNVPLWTNCDAGSCLFNLVYGTAREIQATSYAVRATAETVARHAEPIAANTAATTKNTARITSSLASPFSWLWRGVKAVLPFI